MNAVPTHQRRVNRQAGEGKGKANGNTIFTIVNTVSPNEVVLSLEITLETALCIIG
ncbi:MAG: hypothetical protein KJP26_04735 [Maribacter sp.]|nr:hypothetical protein [Maribacter sp.]